jgi:hypothetical protein
MEFTMTFKLFVQSVFNYCFSCTEDFLLRLNVYFHEYYRSKNSLVKNLIYAQYFNGSKPQQIYHKTNGANLNANFF